ncbi:MAG: hypothetical protein M1831_006145 [Alyxoria varia]|nr:MAG: hypothetical protein M1831_006145 [Alyxoria varia]
MAQDKGDEAFLRSIVKANETPKTSGKKRNREEAQSPSPVQWDSDRIPINRERPKLPDIDAASNPFLATAPFIHSSQIPESRGLIAGSPEEPRCYEPLEFLGDAYLELMATEVLFYRYPNLPVGQRSAMREQMVRNDTLYRFSVWYGWNNTEGSSCIRVDQNTQNKSKPEVWMKIIADVFEAKVAAIVLSDKTNGYATAKRWLTELWEAFGLIHAEEIAVSMVTKEIKAAKALRSSNESKKEKPLRDGPRKAPSQAVLEQSGNLNYKDMLASLVADQEHHLAYNVIRHSYESSKSRPPDEVRINFSGFGRWEQVELGYAQNKDQQPKKKLEQSAAKDALIRNSDLINEIAAEKWKVGVKRRANGAKTSGNTDVA